MAKVLVEIDMPNVSAKDILNNPDEWEAGHGDNHDESYLAVDDAYLRTAADDDSFYVFRCVAVLEDSEHVANVDVLCAKA